MEEEIQNKKVFVGETGHKAEVEEESRSIRSIPALHARDLVMRAGKTHTPPGADYLGFGVIFYYGKKNPMLGKDDFIVACQTDITKVNEGHADMGWKQLRAAFQKAYGRMEPKGREN